jgi:glycosyltransferase involved in cell wall biosynthesis
MPPEKTKPMVSIVIPCRNERDFIGGLLENIRDQDYPKDRMEVFVIDGMSDDGTRAIVSNFVEKFSYVKLVDNEQRVVPHALNRGIKISHGEFIIRMDSHASYPKDYVSKLLYWQQKLGADNVGGVWITRPSGDSVRAKAIARVLSHPLGVGDAYFRIGVDEPREVDVVPFGCYRRDVFDRIGLFDEELVRNQDDEFNARLKNHGGKIFIVPEIEITYYARKRIRDLWRMYFQYGYFKPLVNLKLRTPSNLRQFVPLLFLLSLIVSLVVSVFYRPFFWIFGSLLAIYFVLYFIVSFCIAVKNGIKLLFPLFLSFASVHFSYGTGYLKGFVDFGLLRRHRRKNLREMRLSR